MAIHHITFRGECILAKQLINRGANVNIKENNMGNTPLILACQNNNYNMVKCLVENRSNINTYGMLKKVAVIESLKVGNKRIAEFLMGSGANLNMVDGDGITALKCACNMNDFRLAKKIMRSLSNDTNTRVEKLKSMVDDKQSDELLKDTKNEVLKDIREEKMIREREEIIELIYRGKRAISREI